MNPKIPICCDDQDVRFRERDGRPFCANCRRFLDAEERAKAVVFEDGNANTTEEIQ